jgi:hypothetical protein
MNEARTEAKMWLSDLGHDQCRTLAYRASIVAGEVYIVSPLGWLPDDGDRQPSRAPRWVEELGQEVLVGANFFDVSMGFRTTMVRSF